MRINTSMDRLNLKIGALLATAVLPPLVLALVAGFSARPDVETSKVHLEKKGPPAEETASPAFADKVLVLKAQRRLQLLRGESVIRSYRISLGAEPKGHKAREGDQKTPEGVYTLDWRNPDSRFHKSIHISYPNQKDLSHAHTLGVPPGGNIMIHGLPNKPEWPKELHEILDWTDGCIAVTNDEMDEIWELVQDGTAIEIRWNRPVMDAPAATGEVAASREPEPSLVELLTKMII